VGTARAMRHPLKPTRRAPPYAGLGISGSTYQLPIEPSAIPRGVVIGSLSGSRPTSTTTTGRAADVTAVAKGKQATKRHELGRRVQSRRPDLMPSQWRKSGRQAIVR
jgi:hypothetical protein